MNFWKKLPKPIIVLAPLADVTDAAFRKLIAKHSAYTRADLPAPRPNIFYVYAILCDDDSIYIGQTQDLRQRWKLHVAGKASGHTNKHKPLKIIHYEEVNSREKAVEREQHLKTGFGRKWLKREYKAGRTRQAGGTVGGPDVFWTEFVSADGLMRATPEGKEKLMADLIYTEEERPIVAQLFSSTPEHMEGAARLCRELGFDGVDINMGCPDRSIERQGCGSAMIKNPENAREIIRAAKRGAGDIPVSVKTRLGYNKDELETWLPQLLAEEPAVVTIHARTRKEMSKVPARWGRIARAVEIRDELGSETLIFGNGDALSVEDARQKAELSGADGVMLGRAIFGNPWLFNPEKCLSENITSASALSPSHRAAEYDSGVRSEDGDEVSRKNGCEVVTINERLEALLEHSRLFVELLPHKNFAVMKKHYKAYINSFPGASELRAELMNANDLEEVEEIVERVLAKV